MNHAQLAKKARDAAGGTGALAHAVGCSSSEVSQWISGRRPIPIAAAALIEGASKGAVTRRDLWPEQWHLIWPELAKIGGVSQQVATGSADCAVSGDTHSA